MFVIVIGGGRVGSHLASSLIKLEHEVRLIEHRSKVVEMLHREIPTESIFEGDPLDSRVLSQVGAGEAQVLVAASADDAMNLAVAFLAKTEFKVPRVIGRVNNPRYSWLFRPEMGMDVSVNQAELLARFIQEEIP